MGKLASLSLRGARKGRTIARDSVFWFDKFWGNYFSKDSIHIITTKLIPLKKYLCIFSHSDKNKKISINVLDYLAKLKEADCDIVFVTTLKTLQADDQEKISVFCHKIIYRRDIGGDFSSYKTGIMHSEDITQYQKLLLVNHSEKEPFDHLQSLLNFKADKNIGLLGYNDSWARDFYIKRNCLIFSKPAIQHEIFASFWRGVVPLFMRNNIIYEYDIKLCQLYRFNHFLIEVYSDNNENKLYLDYHTTKAFFGDWANRFQLLFNENR